jgi:hypothetical protein
MGGNWTESILWDFGKGNDGDNPLAGLLIDSTGNLYGTTNGGHVASGFVDGTVFKLTILGLTASPAKLNFGNVVAPGTSKPKTMKLINKGTLPAQIAGLTATAPFEIAGGADTCTGQSIAPKKTCTFAVEFAPTTVGKATGGIDVTYNGTSPTVALAGNGVAPK